MFISAKIATSQGIVEIASVDGHPMRRGSPVTITVDGETRDFAASTGIFARNPEASRDTILGSGAFHIPGFVARIQEEAVSGFNAQPSGERTPEQREGVKSSIVNLIKMLKAGRPAQDILTRTRNTADQLFPWDTNPEARISEIRDEMAHASPTAERDLMLISEIRDALNAAVQTYSDTFVDVPDLGLDDMDHDISDTPAVQPPAPAVAAPETASKVSLSADPAPTVAAPAKVSEAPIADPATEVDPEDAAYLAAEDGILEAEWDTDTPENPKNAFDEPEEAESKEPEDDLDDDQDIIIPTWTAPAQAVADHVATAARTTPRATSGSSARRPSTAEGEHDDEIPLLESGMPTQRSLFGADPAPADGTTPVLPFDDADFRY